ncbi:selenium-dependent molybdenum cofactor biosynthesis protein YqeB [Desulfitobacterium metallireducens]|uniref:NADP-binding protein n=1 Tax=Desulfitobacterium metallireducens DSM 15288 TaxID=871968 RepID=W0EBX7_9FIRM|nr:selenium-dependent molybdenum cofactor biosynthesis protein YqeB [Desulfitobacterium metallireducens]AHF07043.1 NADP-binding protein [Desulfitobacterium metallireducens DSM 15288]
MKDIRALEGSVVLVRGGGELASGVAWTLALSGFRVIITEVLHPLMVRWPVCFGTAMDEDAWEVEGISSRRVDSPNDFIALWNEGEIPVFVDPELTHLELIQPEIVVDGIMAKRNLGTRRNMASLTIGLGPGFTAQEDVDIVIETNRGHDLGRLIYAGTAQPNTGVPGLIGGYSTERVVYSPQAGVFHAKRSIGEFVKAGEVLGEIIEEDRNLKPVISSIDGVLRGLLRDGTFIPQGVKTGDVDPRAHKEYCWTISEKARTIGGAVLLAIIVHNRA